MKESHRDPDDKHLISFSDVLSILRRSKKKILWCAFAFGTLGMLWAVIKPIRYHAEGTFREKGIKQSPFSSSSSIVHLLSNGGNLGSTESEATSSMLSRAILKDVVEKLNLQGNLQAQQDSESFSTLVKRNISLALAALKNTPRPILKNPCCPIKIESLKYTGEIPLNFKLMFAEDQHYDVFDASDDLVGQGQLGEPFQFREIALTLIPVDSKPIEAQSFGLNVDSMANTTKAMSNVLVVEPTKLDKSMLKIQYQHRNRHVASDVVNALMESYQNYSKKYHGDMAMKQLDYLSQRRDHLTQKLN